MSNIRQNVSCQTFNDTNKEVQTLCDQYQQTIRRDYYLSSHNDKIIYANTSYISSETIEQKRIDAAIIIQKYWRRWLAIKERSDRLNALLLRVNWAENMRKGRTEIRLLIAHEELRRQHNPSTMLDIELLYRGINDWRKKELEFIDNHRWGPDRKAALSQIAEMELDLLLDLERTKVKIKKGLKDKVIQRAFQKMGDPTRALNKSGKFFTWDSPTKVTSRSYTKLYNSLNEPILDQDDRFALLQVLYNTVSWHSSFMTKYLTDLIEKEIKLSKDPKDSVLLKSVQKRLAMAFYRLCRDPSFNPEAEKLQKTPFDLKKLRKEMVQCVSCRQLKLREEFTILYGVNIGKRCKNCMGLYRNAILRADLNLYRHMLNELRTDEHDEKVENSVTYLIDVYDLQFLVEQVWHSQSALSGIDNRYLLRLCRWDKDLPWTPWNCVLLTEEEAVAHLKIQDLKTAYQQSFLDKVNVKHEAARIYFSRLTQLSIPLDPKLENYCISKKSLKKSTTDEKLGSDPKNSSISTSAI